MSSAQAGGMLSALWPEGDNITRCGTVALTFLGCYVLKKLIGKLLPSSIRQRKFTAANFTSERGVLVLHQFSRGKTCPNLSPFALKLECFLRLSNVPYIVDCTVPLGPTGKCPWVNMDNTGQPMGDSQFIIDAITAREKGGGGGGLAGDARLAPRDAGALEGMRCLVEEQLFWCVIYYRYVLDRCRVFLTTQRFPWFLRHAFPLFMVRGIEKKAKMQGIAGHSPQQVYDIAKRTCEALDQYLEERAYFCGPEPGTADCAIFGGLAQIRWNAPDTQYESIVTEHYPRLAAYCDRMKERIFPDWDQLTLGNYRGDATKPFVRISDQLIPKLAKKSGVNS